MPTIKEVLNKVKLQGNISEEIKCIWLGHLDKKKYKYPDDADTELEYSFNLYKLYLIAMNEFFTGDLSDYAATAILFEQAYAKERRLKNVLDFDSIDNRCSDCM